MRVKVSARLLLVPLSLVLMGAGTGRPAHNGRIAFSKDVGGVSEIFVMNGDGTKIWRLTRFDELRPGVRGRYGAYNRFPEWSSDGKWIAFISGNVGEPRKNVIYMMKADGSQARPLLRSHNAVLGLSWYLDGKWILFGEWSSEGGHTINLLDVERRLRRPFSGLEGVPQGGPAWSPNGKKVAFSAKPPDARVFQIYVMNANGTGVERVGNFPSNASSPAWSPDGGRIAFVLGSTDADYSIWTIKTDGSKALQVVGPGDSPGSPEWSPDGSRLVFRAGGSWTSDLYLVNADGSGMRRLTRDRAMSQHPAWTP